MDRLAQVFARTRSENRAAFVAYLCAGDPDFDTSLALCQAALGAGVDILELGVPFSDPVADGPTNQQAAQRALESGTAAMCACSAASSCGATSSGVVTENSWCTCECRFRVRVRAVRVCVCACVCDVCME